MGEVFQFVDSIAANPTVRLDLNAGNWSTHRTTEFGMPPMKRSVTGTMLRDGEYVGATAYGNRELRLVLDLRATSQDTIALEFQRLARELDRPSNLLKYQPTAATHPVFFRTFRTSIDSHEWNPDRRRLTVTLLAEPAALGLREDIGPITVNNDPAHVTNPMRFDLTGVKGDLETPLVVRYVTSGFNATLPPLALGVFPGSAPYPVVLRQAESLTLGTDTTSVAVAGNSGGNVARVSFATNANMVTRLSTSTDFPLAGPLGGEYNGSYRVFVALKKTAAAAGDAFALRMAQTVGGPYQPAVTVPLHGSFADRVMVEVGVYNINNGIPKGIGYDAAAIGTAASTAQFELQAQRVSGTNTLDIDYVLLVPTSYRYGVVSGWINASAGEMVLDGVNESVGPIVSPFTATPKRDVLPFMSLIGGFPVAPPGDSRFYLLAPETGGFIDSLTATITVRVSYWPRYLHVRPATT